MAEVVVLVDIVEVVEREVEVVLLVDVVCDSLVVVAGLELWLLERVEDVLSDEVESEVDDVVLELEVETVVEVVELPDTSIVVSPELAR